MSEMAEKQDYNGCIGLSRARGYSTAIVTKLLQDAWREFDTSEVVWCILLNDNSRPHKLCNCYLAVDSDGVGVHGTLPSENNRQIGLGLYRIYMTEELAWEALKKISTGEPYND